MCFERKYVPRSLFVVSPLSIWFSNSFCFGLTPILSLKMDKRQYCPYHGRTAKDTVGIKVFDLEGLETSYLLTENPGFNGMLLLNS